MTLSAWNRVARANRGIAEANTKRFHGPELASVGGAPAYVDRDWTEARVKGRYEWLFTCSAATVPV